MEIGLQVEEGVAHDLGHLALGVGLGLVDEGALEPTFPRGGIGHGESYGGGHAEAAGLDDVEGDVGLLEEVVDDNLLFRARLKGDAVAAVFGLDAVEVGEAPRGLAKDLLDFGKFLCRGFSLRSGDFGFHGIVNTILLRNAQGERDCQF